MGRVLGGFEQLVLLALFRLGDGTHGAEIRREIERRTGREASTGALYTTLERLERRGLVSCSLGSPTPQRGGRRRKLYVMEAEGVSALQDSFHAFTQMADGLGEQLTPPPIVLDEP